MSVPFCYIKAVHSAFNSAEQMFNQISLGIYEKDASELLFLSA